MASSSFYIVVPKDSALFAKGLGELSYLGETLRNESVYLFNNPRGLGIQEVFNLFSDIQFISVRREVPPLKSKDPCADPHF